jgi:hypothetical protein
MKLFLKKAICFFLGHKDGVWDAHYFPTENPAFVIVYSYQCDRCKRIREYER